VTNPQLFRFRQHADIAAPAVIAAICLLTATLGEPGRLALRYDRMALEAGQLWRTLSGHFVHLGLTHTLLNVAGLVLVAALFRRDLGLVDWIGGGLTAACGIAAGLYWMDPQTAWYVGLSGLLHAWFVIGAIGILRSERAFGLVLLCAVAGKLVYEQTVGTMPSTAALAVGPVIVSAHLYGAVAAALYCAALHGLRLVARSQRRL